MAFLTRIYYNAVFGALGGLLGWMLFGVFVDNKASDDTTPAAQMSSADRVAQEKATDARVRRLLLLGGACIGGSIGYFVVSVEALRDRSALRFLRLASYGVVLGAAGGALGMWIGDETNFWLIGKIGYSRASSGFGLYLLQLLGTMFARGLGWTFLGLAIGGSEGIAARSLGKFSYGTIGGTLGGGFGGALFGLAYQLTTDKPAYAALFGALGLVILGASIGSLSAFVQGVFQPASVKVMRGWQEGREYPLDKATNKVGRDEHADIALFRDMRVEKQHVVIHRAGKRFILENKGAPPEFTRVNDQPVAGKRELEDGDRIQLGNVVLRFQMRAAATRKLPPPPRFADVPRDAKFLPADAADKHGTYANAQQRSRRP
jgi:Inner membrane component of T3SS, cytoplasmic domain